MSYKLIISSLLAICVLLLGVYSVWGYGVASGYSAESPLELYPGETREITVAVQNVLPDDEDINLNIALSGDELLTTELIGPDTISVLKGTEVPVMFRVSLSSDATVGTTQTASILFTQTSSAGDEGTIAFAQDVGRELPIRVIAQPALEEEDELPVPTSSGGNTMWGIIGIAVLVIVIAIVIMRRRGSSEGVASLRADSSMNGM